MKTTNKFTKENLALSSAGGFSYIHFVNDTGDRRFVARFYAGQKASARPFMTMLRKRFTVGEYFARIDAGETPIEIAESKGFVLSHLKRMLKDAGYPTTQEGYARWMRDTYGPCCAGIQPALGCRRCYPEN